MGSMKSNVFWAVIAVVIVVEVAAYLIVVRKQAANNKESVETINAQIGELDSIDPVNEEMLKTAESFKKNVGREYAKMVLFLIGKDDLLEHYHPGFDSKPRLYSPREYFKVTSQDRNKVANAIDRAVQHLTEKARVLGLVARDSRDTPWDIIQLTGLQGAPDLSVLQHGQKQYWVQEELLAILERPIDGEERPPVARLGKVKFEPYRDKGPYEPRYRQLEFSFEVALPEGNVGVILERIAKSEFPFVIKSFSAKRSAETGRRDVLTAGTDMRLVAMKVNVGLLDFSMGVGKVEFSLKEFENPESVSQWLEEQTDPALKALKAQLEKHDVKPTVGLDSIAYLVHNLPNETETCEIADGVKLYYGTVESILPESVRH